jgi:hypothetical protein
MRNIHSAFQKAGIVTLNPSVILDQLISQPEDLKSPTHDGSNLSRPTTSYSSLQTPQDYAKLLTYCRRLEEQIERYGNEHSPSRRLSTKVCHAVIRKSAEFAILQKDNAGLTKVIAAKNERKKLTKNVLSTGRVLTLVQVQEAREKERKRETERKEAKERKEKKRKREEVVLGPSPKRTTHRENMPESSSNGAGETPTQIMECELQNRAHLELSTSEPETKADFYQPETAVAEFFNVRANDASVAPLSQEGVTGPLPLRRGKRPPKCSGCGVQGHTFRGCPQNPNRRV